jgi:hypothetical protein
MTGIVMPAACSLLLWFQMYRIFKCLVFVAQSVKLILFEKNMFTLGVFCWLQMTFLVL